MKKIDGVLDQLEAEAKSLKGKLDLGTITIGCALGYLDFRFGARTGAPSGPSSPSGSRPSPSCRR